MCCAQGLGVRPLDVTRSLPPGDLLDLRGCALQSAELSSSPDGALPRLEEGARGPWPALRKPLCHTSLHACMHPALRARAALTDLLTDLLTGWLADWLAALHACPARVPERLPCPRWGVCGAGPARNKLKGLLSFMCPVSCVLRQARRPCCRTGWSAAATTRAGRARRRRPRSSSCSRRPARARAAARRATPV